jgi:ATP-dependent DNA helicase RecQ
MTRAKQNLTIHLNGNYLDDISCQNIERINDDFQYNPSNLLVTHLTHKDIWLDYFISKQDIITNLKSGDELIVNNDGCSDKKGNCILKFSNSYKEKIIEYEKSGYKLSESKINYIVYWKKEEHENEILIVLPELRFKKHDDLKKAYR